MRRYEGDGEAGLLERRHFRAFRRYRDSVTGIFPAKHIVVDQDFVVARQHVNELILTICVLKNDFTNRKGSIISK